MNEKSDARKNDKENTAAIVDCDFGIVYDESSVNLPCHAIDWAID